MNREVNVTKRVKTLQGLRYCPVVLSANGRIRPDWVLVNGSEERHPEGAYYLEWREGTKRTRLSVGNDPATATARRMQKEAELNAKNNGVEVLPVLPQNGNSGHRSLATAVAEFLEETRLTKKPKTLAAYTTSDTLNTISLPTFNLARTQNQLTYSTVLDAPARHLWEIKWKLSKPTTVGGEVIQHVMVNGGCHQVTMPCNAPGALNYDYWEAWEWPPFNSPTTSIFRVYGFDDAFRGPTGTKFNAEARFYPGLALPGSFIPSNPATGAGDLPSTVYDPQLSTTNATPPVNRIWVAP